MRRLALLLVLALGACTIASCGGGDDKASVEDLLDKAFSGQINSADLKIEAEIELKGLLKDPIKIEAEGPFHTNAGKLPSADIELRVGTGGGGQTITSGVLTTGDRVFLKFQDVYYEQPAAQVRQTNRALTKRKGEATLGELGLNPRSWLAQAKDEGDAEVAGVDTNHVSGTLDVAALMRNVNKFVRRSASALGSGQDTPAPLTAADIRELAAAVKDPSFDVYVGKRDNLIRRVSGRIEFDIPEADQSGLGGLKGGSIKFSVELHNVNGNQQIEAPAHSRPLSKLTDSLGGAIDALGVGGATRQEPGPEAGQSGSGSTDAEQFRRYADCLDKARPEDTEQLQRCADLLQQP
ncbi:MAG: hypothetical protein QOE60_1200 [Thermoleophilaceae bacterium]|nr:hypothetical protein [Thermoleophilaceae bacterium]